MPAANSRTPSQPTANCGACRAWAACRGVGTPRVASRTRAGPSLTIAYAAGRSGTGRSRGTASDGGTFTSPGAADTRLAVWVLERSVSGPLAARCTTCAPGVATGSACGAETAAVEVDAAAPCVDAAAGRAAGVSTRDATGRPTDSGRGALAVAVRTTDAVDPAIVIPASSAPCWAGAVADGAAASGDVPAGFPADAVDGVAGDGDAVAVTVVGGGVGTGDETGVGDGGAGGWTATGAGARAGAATGSGAGDGAGAGAVRGGRSPSGSTYPSSSDAWRIPRWTLGSSCSGVPLMPIVPTVSPSPTEAPFATSIEPRWTRVTEYPSAVRMVTPRPWVGRVPAKVTRPAAGALTAEPFGPATSMPRCCPPA